MQGVIMHVSITTAVFALTSVAHGIRPYNATADAAIHLATFDSATCAGRPQTSPFEMKNGQCVNLRDPHSAKPMLWVGHRQDWIEEINNLHAHCKLELFGQEDCASYTRITSYRGANTEEQPENFNKCLIADALIKSAKFTCVPFGDTVSKTSTLTSYSIDPTYHSAVPFTYVAVLTATLRLPTPPAKVAPGATTEALKHLVKRKNQPGKGVWMQHPWVGSWICYSCYLKQEDIYGKMECKSGRDYPINCGEAPDYTIEGPTTSHTRTTSTRTIAIISHSTTTVKTAHRLPHDSSDSSDSDDENDFVRRHTLVKRSWHTPVKFYHPFQIGKEACADAEWQHRGKRNEYVEIHGVHICDHKDRPDSKWLVLPTSTHTVTAMESVSRTIVHHETSTTTITVPRHDQL